MSLTGSEELVGRIKWESIKIKAQKLDVLING